jgi:hypothetical protein
MTRRIDQRDLSLQTPSLGVNGLKSSGESAICQVDETNRSAAKSVHTDYAG